MDFVELCENRYSVRKFSDRQVEEEEIERYLQEEGDIIRHIYH